MAPSHTQSSQLLPALSVLHHSGRMQLPRGGPQRPISQTQLRSGPSWNPSVPVSVCPREEGTSRSHNRPPTGEEGEEAARLGRSEGTQDAGKAQARPGGGGSGVRGHQSPSHTLCYFPGLIFVLHNTEAVHLYVQKSSGFLHPRSNSLPLSSWTGSRGTWLKSQPTVSKPRAARPQLPHPQDHRPRWQGCRG